MFQIDTPGLTLLISINFEVTLTFLAIGLVDTAQLSGDSHWAASDYNIFQNGVLYRKAIMNEDIWKFRYDRLFRQSF